MSTPNNRLEILFPTGRYVQGSLTEMQTTDADGKPLVVKNGPNAGQPTERSFFALAIKKGAETHWGQTPWGMQLWNAAAAAWPQGQSGSPSFAFKVEDGDSVIPNTKGKKNCDRTGFPGNWILNFGSGYPVKVVNDSGTVALSEAQAKQIKLGHYIQVFGSYVTNDSALKPGMYLNHMAVSYQGFGEEIHIGIDTTRVGFGSGAKPAGMSAVPVGGASPAQMAAAAGAPPLPGIPPLPAAAPAIPTGIPPFAGIPGLPPTAVAPAAPFVQQAAAPPPPAPPAPPAADPVTTTGIAYASYIAQGWSVAQMKAQGVIA